MEGSEGGLAKKEDWIMETRAVKRAAAHSRRSTVGLRVLLEDDPLWSLILASSSMERDG